jgi:hypothetical protein
MCYAGIAVATAKTTTTTKAAASIKYTSSTPESSDCRSCAGRCVIGRPVLPHSETKQTTGSVTVGEIEVTTCVGFNRKYVEQNLL